MTANRFAACVLLGAALIEPGCAGTAAIQEPAATGLLVGKLAEGSAYDRLWSVPTLYKNEQNPFLQELAFQGQLQLQYAAGTNDSGSFGTADRPDACNWGDIEVRRFRFGARARLFNSLKLHTLWDLYPDFSPRIYQRTAETYICYAPRDAFNLGIGKAELKFTREQEISSREILTFERSQIINQLYGGELTGAWITGKNIAGGWFYELGAYSNERRDEWPRFDGGTIVLAKIGCNYTAHTSFDNAFAELHYLHNSEPGYTSPGDPPSPPYADAVAFSNTLAEGRFGLQTEVFWGDGKLGRPDIWGISAIPSWNFTEKLQGVALLEYAHSNAPDGIYLPTRYEGCSDTADITSGDSYASCYAGLNYYLYGHKLKLMTGVKYAHLDEESRDEDFTGWTWLAGFRMGF